MSLNYTTTVSAINGTIFRATIDDGLDDPKWFDGKEEDVTLAIVQTDGSTVDVKLTRADFESVITHFYRSLGLN